MFVRRLVMVLSVVTCGSLALAAAGFAAGGGLDPGKYSFNSGNRDGLPDLIARKPDGSMWIARGQPDHTLATPQQMPGTSGWDQYSTIVGGDWTHSGHEDLGARASDGGLWLVSGNGATSLAGSFEMSNGWNSFS
jgi:hypothetical protein